MGAATAGIAPFFTVRNVPAALALYRDRLAFEVMDAHGYGLVFGRPQR